MLASTAPPSSSTNTDHYIAAGGAGRFPVDDQKCPRLLGYDLSSQDRRRVPPPPRRTAADPDVRQRWLPRVLFAPPPLCKRRFQLVQRIHPHARVPPDGHRPRKNLRHRTIESGHACRNSSQDFLCSPNGVKPGLMHQHLDGSNLSRYALHAKHNERDCCLNLPTFT